jgi:cobyrinic acid a,c-diamide synthase
VKKADKFALEREMKMLFTGGVEREDSEKIRERFLGLYYKLT